MMRNLLLAVTLACCLRLSGQAAELPQAPSIEAIGGPKLEGWKGFTAGADQATLSLPGEATFRYPEGVKGWFHRGFRVEHDGTRDWRDFYGVKLEVQVSSGHSCQLTATLETPEQLPRQEFSRRCQAVLTLGDRTGWQSVTLPFSAFDFKKSQRAILQFVQQLKLTLTLPEGSSGGEVALKNIRLVRAPSVALDTPVRGQAVAAGETAYYQVTLTNCTDMAQEVNLSFEKYGFEAMPVSVTPTHLQIPAASSKSCEVSVSVPKEGLPPGSHETQKLVALTGGSEPEVLELTTARDLPRPFLQLTPEGWQAVRDKVSQYDWAKQAQADILKAADDWQVAEVATPEQREHGPEQHTYTFLNPEFEKLPRAAIAWQLTRDKRYAEKAALFLRRLADEKTGYPSTFAGTSMGSPQEGGNFQGVAIAYDAILDAGVLNADDRRAIEQTMRLFMETYETDLTVGNMGNWAVAASTASLFCALAMGDLTAAHRYIEGPAGFVDFVSKGVMNDGWWWECSTSYNFWVASELTQAALACQPWGIDLLHQEFPASNSPYAIINPWGLEPPYGMSFEKWGPNTRNTRSVKQLWDAVPIVADYRGIAFGMNDGHEEQVGGPRLELAYHAFHDPAYVPLLKLGKKRDLLYGEPELPDDSTRPYTKSGYAESLGYALLRSQTEPRPQREQIEAVFKIGTQGGYHGHFDRASLNTIMRYGRSYWDPESIWWGYANYMYKFFVQTSVNHNLVVVDQQQQEAVPSSQLLFYSGKMMQVSAQETNARWSDPPYAGMKLDASASGGAVAGTAALMRKTRQSFPFVPDRREGELGSWSDRVLQRRLGIVTDDYIVIADFLRAERPHVFDNLFQLKGFVSLEASGRRNLRHDAQYNSDPHSSAQFITSADWYQANAPAVGHFELNSEPSETGRTHNEPGLLKLDLHSLWPARHEIMLANAPENQDTQQWVTYELLGDGKVLAQGESGVWILGAISLDVAVPGVKELTLRVKTEGNKKKSLFLVHPILQTAGGKEVPIGAEPTLENVELPLTSGRDYYSGPVTVAGITVSDPIPAQPKNSGQPAVIQMQLTGRDAVRFKATLGGDYPCGQENQTRKVYAIRSQGKEARFLTVIEPFENKALVKAAAASGPDTLRVELTDGRVQDIRLQNLEGDGKNILVTIKESGAGKLLREEASSASEKTR